MSRLCVPIKGLKPGTRTEESLFCFGIHANHVIVQVWVRAGDPRYRAEPRSSRAPSVNLQRFVWDHPNMDLPFSIGLLSNSHALIPHPYLSETRFAVLLVERLGRATSDVQ